MQGYTVWPNGNTGQWVVLDESKLGETGLVQEVARFIDEGDARALAELLNAARQSPGSRPGPDGKSSPATVPPAKAPPVTAHNHAKPN